MKSILQYCLIVLSSYTSYSQAVTTSKVPVLPLTANRIVYTGSIAVDTSITKQQLLENAEKWYARNFETADNTLTIDNADDGKISGTGIIHLKKKEKEVDPEDLFFTIDILVSKGNYTYKVYGIYGIDNKMKFYYSDMYNEELYPTDKPKWPAAYRYTMIMNMDTRINDMIKKIEPELNKK